MRQNTPQRAGTALLSLVIASLLLASLPMNIRAASVGVLAPGFSNFKPIDVGILADEFAAAGGEVEIAALPFTFNPADPFGNIDSFVKNVVPRFSSGSTLRVSVFIWFDEWDGEFDFKNFSNKAAFLKRVKTFDVWVKNIRHWASERGFSSRLSIHLVPFFEDRAPNAQAFGRALNFIVEQQRADGVRTPFRRSPDAASASFRVDGITQEFHGRFKDWQNFFTPFDTFSNNGCFVGFDGASFSALTEFPQSFPGFCSAQTSFSEFLLDQQFGLKQQISFLFWRPVFDGLTQYAKTVPPKERFHLAPFTGVSGDVERFAVRRVLSTQ